MRAKLRVTAKKSFADRYSSRSGRQIRLTMIPEMAVFYLIHLCFYYLIMVVRTDKPSTITIIYWRFARLPATYCTEWKILKP